MTNDRQDHARNDKPGRARWLIVPVGLLAFGVLLFFAGRLIYGLGQRSAAKISGVDLTTSATVRAEPTMTSTITPTASAALSASFTPGPTSTSFFPPTATATKIPWTSCPGIVVTVTDTQQGDIVHVLRCEDGLEYDLGPLPKGVFAVSPDDNYIVYAAQDGVIYAARVGSTALTVIRKTGREFYTFGQDMAPIFKISFTGESPYVLELYEARYGQNLPIRMPGWLSE